MNAPDEKTIHALLSENRTFPPDPAFTKNAWVKDDSVYAEAEKDFEGFWARFAGAIEWVTK